MSGPTVAVVGSVNVDLTARVGELPMAGETVAAHTFHRGGGGKGANQALVAARLGARVRLIAAVGGDADAELALSGLSAAGVEIAAVRRTRGPTGTALIVVDDGGENQIVVAAGANGELKPADLGELDDDIVLSQLEVPLETVSEVARRARGFFSLNPSPVLGLPPGILERADLLVVNSHEARAYGDLSSHPLVAVTKGADGAVLLRDGVQVAATRPPAVTARDGTGAGDAFCAALAVSLFEGREDGAALARACAAGALAASRPGAQEWLPEGAEVDALLGRFAR